MCECVSFYVWICQCRKWCTMLLCWRGQGRHSGTPGCNWCVLIILELQPETYWAHMKQCAMGNLCHFFSCLQKYALHTQAIPQHYFLEKWVLESCHFWKASSEGLQLFNRVVLKATFSERAGTKTQLPRSALRSCGKWNHISHILGGGHRCEWTSVYVNAAAFLNKYSSRW